MPLEVSLIQNYTLKLVSGVPLFIQLRLEVGSIGKLERLVTCPGSTSKARAWLRLKKFGLAPPPGRMIFSENPRSLKNCTLRLLNYWESFDGKQITPLRRLFSIHPEAEHSGSDQITKVGQLWFRKVLGNCWHGFQSSNNNYDLN